jgi:hypothetical protein
MKQNGVKAREMARVREYLFCAETTAVEKQYLKQLAHVSPELQGLLASHIVGPALQTISFFNPPQHTQEPRILIPLVAKYAEVIYIYIYIELSIYIYVYMCMSLT